MTHSIPKKGDVGGETSHPNTSICPANQDEPAAALLAKNWTFSTGPTVFWDSSAGSPGGHANPPPALQSVGGGDRGKSTD
jgi:hypothetical protein